MNAAGAPGGPVFDGFWLPRAAREQVFSAATRWETLWFSGGRPCDAPASAGGQRTGGRPAAGGPSAAAVGARRPVFSHDEWDSLLDALSAGRRRAPQGAELSRRLRTALAQAAPALGLGARTGDGTVAALASSTGYSQEMIGAALGTPDLWTLGEMTAAVTADPTWDAAGQWQRLPGLEGRLRFYPARGGYRGERPAAPIFATPATPALVAGYGAGNVPGTALLIVLLALATAATGAAPPVVVVRNSRREPIFSPLVLAAVEAVDPDVVGSVAVFVWDYADGRLQRWLLAQADLVIAAAGDDAIADIGAQVKRATTDRAARERTAREVAERERTGSGGEVIGPGPALPGRGGKPGPGEARAGSAGGWRGSAAGQSAPVTPRFHAHGHKASFAVIGREALERGAGERLPLDAIAFLAALDSAVWDQNGCLSARVHFVEGRHTPADGSAGAAAPGSYSPLEYAAALAAQLRPLAVAIPRGRWPRRALHDAFDRYAALTGTDLVRVLSGYDDDFVVAYDARPPAAARRGRARVARGLDALALSGTVGACQGRVVVVRPVDDLLEVPRCYLSLLPPATLQSLSVAVGSAGDRGLSERFLRFAEACGACGVTGIRPLGRGAFPRLAYSWDGFLPRDLVSRRPPGHFTTIESETPYEAMCETYRRFSSGAGPCGR